MGHKHFVRVPGGRFCGVSPFSFEVGGWAAGMSLEAPLCVRNGRVPSLPVGPLEPGVTCQGWPGVFFSFVAFLVLVTRPVVAVDW